MISNEKKEKLETYFTEIALKSILKHPKAKLYASANPIDKFTLVMFTTADNAVMSEVSEFFEQDTIEWYDYMCDTKSHILSRYNPFINSICHKAYNKLNNK